MTKPSDLYVITLNTIFAKEVRNYIEHCKNYEATKEQIKEVFDKFVEVYY